jgi:hypothetical protein
MDARDHQNRGLDMLAAQSFQKWCIDLSERFDARIILREVQNVTGGVDTGDGARQFRLPLPVSGKAQN